MVKVLLLESWYGLGDPATEEALGDRLSFRRFAGLGWARRCRPICLTTGSLGFSAGACPGGGNERETSTDTIG